MNQDNRTKRNTAIVVIVLVCIGLALRGLPKSVPDQTKAVAIVAVAFAFIGLLIFGYLKNRTKKPRLTAEQRKKFKTINGGLSTVPKPNKKSPEHLKVISSGKSGKRQ
jgi:hypothetical protein